MAKYTASGKDKSGHKTYRELQKPRLVNHYVFEPQKNEDRKTTTILSSFCLFLSGTKVICFLRVKLLRKHLTACFPQMTTAVRTTADCRRFWLFRPPLRKSTKPGRLTLKTNNLNTKVEGEAKAAMQDVVDMHDNAAADTITLEERVDMLNADQRRVFEKVKSHFLHQQLHEGNKCQCNLEPLRMFVSGVGGTGKSFLIETIKALVDQLWPSNDLSCAIAAPTGLAAFNVGGTTIHRLFQLFCGARG